MFNRAPSPGRLTLALLCLAGLAGLFFWVRCTRSVSPQPVAVVHSATTKVAHLTMLNGSPCEWQIVFTPVAGGERHAWKLSVDQSLEVDLTGGDYAVEQTMLMDDAGPEAMRRFSMRLEAGQVYRWRLVTLLSGAADDVRLSVRDIQRP